MAEKSYNDMKVDELEAELDQRGLPKSGNKDELIERLEANDEALAGDGQDGDDTSAASVPMKAPGGRTQSSPADNPAVPTKDSSDEEDEEPSWRATAPASRRREGEDGEVTEEEVGVYVGVDPDYQNFANDTEAPLLSQSGVEAEAEEQALSSIADQQRRSAKVGVTGHSAGADYDLGRENVRGFSPTSKPAEESDEGESDEE